MSRHADPNLAVRRFEAADAVPLTELLHEAYAELGARGLNFTAVDQSAQTTLARSLAGQCWVVVRREEIVGSLTMSLPPSRGLQELTPAAREDGRAWLNQVAVSPRLRGRGIAADLWRRGHRWAAAQGATSVGVDTAAPAVHLVQLYTAWGFAQVDTIRWPDKVYDSVVMTRLLSADDA